MIEVESSLSSALTGSAPSLPSTVIGNVETLSAVVAYPGPLGGNQASAYGPRDFVAITMLLILFLVIATLGHLAFAVQRWPKRWVPVRVRSRDLPRRDSRWR